MNDMRSPFDERAASFAHGSGPGIGPAGRATVEGDGLADGSGSRCSRRPLHAGHRSGGGREKQSSPRWTSRAASRDLDGDAGLLRRAVRQVGEITARIHIRHAEPDRQGGRRAEVWVRVRS